MKKIYSLLLLATVVFYSCKTATKAFEKGNYEDAVTLAVKKLQKDGNDDAAKNILVNAYRQSVEAHEAAIRNLAASTSDNRFERIYSEYCALQGLYESISHSPAAMQAVHATDYASYVQVYKEKTGDTYFDRGLALMEKGDRRSYRQAYDVFRTAYRYKNDSRIKEKMNEAYEAAVVKVLLLTDDPYRAGSMYGNSSYGNGYGNNNYNAGYEIRNFNENLVRNLRYQGSNDFTRFYTGDEARNSNVQPDEIVEMRLGRFDMGRYYDENSYRDVSNRVVVKQVVYRPDSVVNEYATVTARITTTRRIYTSGTALRIDARDAKGNYLWSDVIRGEHRYTVDFASFTGDERALSASDKALINNGSNNGYNQVRAEDITREILKQIETEACNRFRSYFSRYY